MNSSAGSLTGRTYPILRPLVLAGAILVAQIGLPTVSLSPAGWTLLSVAPAQAKPRKAVRKANTRSQTARKRRAPNSEARTQQALERARNRQIPSPIAAQLKQKGAANTALNVTGAGVAATAAAAAATAAAGPVNAATSASNPGPVTTNPDPSKKPLSLTEMRDIVLAAPDETLRRLGRHLIVGYHRAYQIQPLIERGALGGIFVTSRNARGRTKAQITKELTGFREMAERAGQASFWIATDQEGGTVSRLSPPLPYQVALPRLIAKLTTPEERSKAVTEFAAKQSAALAELGINLNFAPVADMNYAAMRFRDRHTRLNYRAISGDVAIVHEVSRDYCAALHANNVICTLKHFPGLGRVTADTHITPASLKTPIEVLEAKDWVPFRKVLATTPAFLMVGHQSLTALDARNPASTSEEVIQGLVRRDWGFDGIVITDDLAMGAIRRRAGGMPQAAIDALNAGADLVLIGLDGNHVYGALYEMMKAEQTGKLGAHTLKSSELRLRSAAQTQTLARDRPGQHLQSGENNSTKSLRQ